MEKPITLTAGSLTQTLTVEEGQIYNHYHIQTGEEPTETTVMLHLKKGATATWHGLSLAGGNARHSTTVLVECEDEAPTVSITQTQLAGGRGEVRCAGTIRVHKKAQKTNATMQCRNLLLSNEARTWHKPELEIEADDVKCAHGATTGGLSEDAVFYFMARGLPESTARTMLAEATLRAALEGLPEETLTQTLAPLINQLQTMLNTHAKR